MKRLYKINDGKVIDGVCGGIANYFDCDPTLVRVIFAIAACCGSFGLWAYLACVLIMPREPGGYIDAE